MLCYSFKDECILSSRLSICADWWHINKEVDLPFHYNVIFSAFPITLVSSVYQESPMGTNSMKLLKCISCLKSFNRFKSLSFQFTHTFVPIIYKFTWNKGPFIRLKCLDGSNREGILALCHPSLINWGLCKLPAGLYASWGQGSAEEHDQSLDKSSSESVLSSAYYNSIGFNSF